GLLGASAVIRDVRPLEGGAGLVAPASELRPDLGAPRQRLLREGELSVRNEDEARAEFALGEQMSIVEPCGELEGTLEVDDRAVGLAREVPLHLGQLEQRQNLQPRVSLLLGDRLRVREREAGLLPSSLLLQCIAETDEGRASELLPAEGPG